MWRIEFTSAEFLPYLPEDAQSNPGAYGFELAHWLSKALAERGVITSYPISEDWGWLLEHIDGDAETTIGCASMSDAGEGYTGQAIRWAMFIKPHQPWRLFGRSPAKPAPSVLTKAVEAVLRARGIAVEQRAGEGNQG